MPIMRRLIFLLWLGWMSGCIDVPEIESAPLPGSGKPDAGSSGTSDSGTQPSDLSIEITQPADIVHTNASVAISVEVRGGAAEAVQLLKNGELLAILPSPFRYTWDTTTEIERSHTLMARVTRSGKTFDSRPVTVVVDRTSVQVVTRSPADGTTNVDYSTPIQVVFTKAVKATTISDTTVGFAVSGVPAEKTLTLSSDGKTLTIKPRQRPVLPATFSVGLSRGITDLAGNALSASGTAWSFEVPDWYAFGGPLHAVGGDNTLLRDPTLVLDKRGNPVIAWSEELVAGGRAAIFVYQWDGKAFTPIGGALNGTGTGSAIKPSMALDSEDRPVIAWQESDGFNENIHVKRWTGTAWQTVGTGALSAVNDTRSPATATPARNPSLALHENIIYVAWDEQTTDGYFTIYVWKSSEGSAFSGAGQNNGMVNAVAKNTSGTKPSIVLNKNGQPIVAFQEATLEQYSPTNIYVMRLQGSGEWTYAVPPFHGDDASGYVSGGLSASTGSTAATNCSLAIDKNEVLSISWTEESEPDSPYDIQAFQLAKTHSWTQLGKALSEYDGFSSASNPSIASSPSGKIFAVWNEYNPPMEHSRLLAAQWNGQSWAALTSRIGLNQPDSGQSSIRSSVSVDNLERPVIAWFQSENNFNDATGKYIYTRRRN